MYNPGGLSGGQYSVFKFAGELSDNHNVTLFYVNHKSLVKESNKRFKTRGILYIPKLSKNPFIYNLIENIYDRFVLGPFLKKNKIDYIIGTQKLDAVKAVSLGKKYNIKVVNFIFETPDWLKRNLPYWEEKWNSDKTLREYWNKFKKALPESDYIIANSGITAEETKKWVGIDVSGIVYPGVIKKFKFSENISKNNQIIYIGRLSPNKNVDEIILALHELQLDLKLVVCGAGSSENELRNIVKEKKVNVEFLGRVTEESKWQELQKSLFMVFPSSFEGFGMPPMEALMTEIPCICSDIKIFKEVYKDKVEYFREHNIEELASKIKYLYINSDYREKRGKEGRSYVIQNFGWEKSRKEIEKILKLN